MDISFSTFNEMFPELGVVEAKYTLLWQPLAQKLFDECFDRLLGSDCETQLRLLWLAHFVWVDCNLQSGGSLESVKQVNSAESYSTLGPDRYLSNLNLSPYGQLISEIANLDYFGAGHIMGCC